MPAAAFLPPLIAASALLAALSVQAGGTQGWDVFDECELRDDKYFDGDSFRIIGYRTPAGGERNTKRSTFHARLYFVDCPETSLRYEERNNEQAEAFGIPVGDVPKWGEAAKEFTKNFLRGGFKVLTQNTETKVGKRYYAMVLNENGEDLAEALVRAGLARAYGYVPDTVPDTPGKAARNGMHVKRRLDSLEAGARADKAGVWQPQRSAADTWRSQFGGGNR